MSNEWDEILDSTKLAYHQERVEALLRGEKVAPITIDMALTRNCNYACGFCAAQYQENDRKNITEDVMERFLTDCAEMGVKGISLISDGESSISPVFEFTIRRGHELGIDMAVGSNAFVITRDMSERILPYLTYLRINFSGGERSRYAQIMGVKESAYDRVVQNIRDMVDIKKRDNLKVTIGLQMVLMPQDADQIIPFAKLGKELRVDYAVTKHCSDTPEHTLGVDYAAYDALDGLLKEAETYSDDEYSSVVKWTKIKANGSRSYQRCYGAALLLQISGSGLVAPCGGTFNDKFRKFHVGNIVDTSFKKMVFSDRYQEIMRHLASPEFDAQKTCDSLCLQNYVNTALDNHVNRGIPIVFKSGDIQHKNFI